MRETQFERPITVIKEGERFKDTIIVDGLRYDGKKDTSFANVLEHALRAELRYREFDRIYKELVNAEIVSPEMYYTWMKEYLDNMFDFSTCSTYSKVSIIPGSKAIPRDHIRESSDFTIESGVLKKYTGPGGDVVIPKGIKIIGKDAFHDCDSLLRVTIPNNVTTIGDYAFDGCSNLKSIELSEGLISIGRFAFDHCSSLKSVKIPASVTSIDKWALGYETVEVRDSISGDRIKNFSISGYKNTAAEVYAKHNYFQFIILEKEIMKENDSQTKESAATEGKTPQQYDSRAFTAVPKTMLPNHVTIINGRAYIDIPGISTEERDKEFRQSAGRDLGAKPESEPKTDPISFSASKPAQSSEQEQHDEMDGQIIWKGHEKGYFCEKDVYYFKRVQNAGDVARIIHLMQRQYGRLMEACINYEFDHATFMAPYKTNSIDDLIYKINESAFSEIEYIDFVFFIKEKQKCVNASLSLVDKKLTLNLPCKEKDKPLETLEEHSYNASRKTAASSQARLPDNIVCVDGRFYLKTAANQGEEGKKQIGTSYSQPGLREGQDQQKGERIMSDTQPHVQHAGNPGEIGVDTTIETKVSFKLPDNVECVDGRFKLKSSINKPIPTKGAAQSLVMARQADNPAKMKSPLRNQRNSKTALMSQVNNQITNQLA